MEDNPTGNSSSSSSGCVDGSVVTAATITRPEPKPSSLFEGDSVYLVEDAKCSLKGCPEDVLLSSLLKDRGAVIVDSVESCNVVVISAQREVSIDSFSGKNIFGQKYVEECIEGNKPFEKRCLPYPLLSHALEGVVVACDAGLILKPGVMSSFMEQPSQQDERVTAGEINSMVKMLGGTFVSSSVTDKSTLFVGVSTLTEGYQSAVKLRIPIVRPSWVVDCFKNQRFSPVDDFRLPTFAGCIICVTGFSVPSRTLIHSMVSSLGGAFRPDFSRCCSHLIVGTPRGPKFKASFLWHIPAVSLSWFFDSVNSRVCLSPDAYLVPDLNFPTDSKHSIQQQSPSRMPSLYALSPGPAHIQQQLMRQTHIQQQQQQQQPQQQQQQQQQVQQQIQQQQIKPEEKVALRNMILLQNPQMAKPNNSQIQPNMVLRSASKVSRGRKNSSASSASSSATPSPSGKSTGSSVRTRSRTNGDNSGCGSVASGANEVAKQPDSSSSSSSVEPLAKKPRSDPSKSTSCSSTKSSSK